MGWFLEGRKKYANIPVPALVIFGIPHSLGKWVDGSTDPKVREEIGRAHV